MPQRAQVRLVGGPDGRELRRTPLELLTTPVPLPGLTLVFDEIDSGIGGRAAEAVGRKLKSLAQSGQVICITHLPQVAVFADHHYLIEKHEAAGKTGTEIRRSEAKQRTQEIARMLSGAKITEIALKNAAEMLKAGG